MGRWWVLWILPDQGAGGILVLPGLESMSCITPALHLAALCAAWTRGTEKFWIIYPHPLPTWLRVRPFPDLTPSLHPSAAVSPACNVTSLCSAGSGGFVLPASLEFGANFSLFRCSCTFLPGVSAWSCRPRPDRIGGRPSPGFLSQVGIDSAPGLPRPSCWSWRAKGRYDAEAGGPDISKSLLCCRWSALCERL